MMVTRCPNCGAVHSYYRKDGVTYCRFCDTPIIEAVAKKPERKQAKKQPIILPVKKEKEWNILNKEYHKKFRELIMLQQNISNKEFHDSVGLTFFQLKGKGRLLQNLRCKGRPREVFETSDKIIDPLFRKHQFVFTNKRGILEENTFRAGSSVFLYTHKTMDTRFGPDEERDFMGLIVSVSDEEISIQIDIPPQIKNRLTNDVTLVLGVDEVTYKKQVSNLNYICSDEFKGNKNVLNCILSSQKYTALNNINKNFEKKEFKFLTRLNENQEEVVKKALAAKDFFLIHGPPGTGKTQVCVEIICQTLMLKKDSKILVACDSNEAVDNIMRKLSSILGEEFDPFILRLGQLFKVSPELEKHVLYNKMDSHPIFSYLVKEVGQHIHKKLGSLNRGNREGKIAVKRELTKLRKIKFALKEKARNDILNSVRVIFCTNTTAEKELKREKLFDLVVLDEAAQSTEPSCLIPISRAKKVILAGDHLQLPPTIIRSDDEDVNKKIFQLENTLFKKLIGKYEDYSDKLTIQYRMNEDILYFPNKEFYDGELKCDESNEFSECNLFYDKSIVFINCNGEETRPIYKKEKGGFQHAPAYYNQEQVDVVKQLVKKFTELGVDRDMLSVISFYKLQMKKINSAIEKYGILCKTVDGFQGQEKEIIILSTVRSNDNSTLRSSLGFLTDERRLNVAVTRPKNKLIIIGNRRTLIKYADSAETKFDKYAKFIEYIRSKELYWPKEEALRCLDNPLPSAGIKVKLKKDERKSKHGELVNTKSKQELYEEYANYLDSLNIESVNSLIEKVLNKHKWHYYLDDKYRKDALISAMLEEGPIIVLKLLKWLSLPRVLLKREAYDPVTEKAITDFTFANDYIHEHNLINQDIQAAINKLYLLTKTKYKKFSKKVKSEEEEDIVLSESSEYDLLSGLFD